MSDLRTAIKPARVRWLDNGAPYSQDFEDIYFSPTDGVAESEYVYLSANRLPGRWCSDQQTHEPTSFTVGELGFGSGLNFLLTLKAWRKYSRLTRLDYFSVEKHPLTRHDLKKALQAFPELHEEATQLLQHYPPLLTGFHRLDFSNGVGLNLLFGDAVDVLATLRHSDRPTLCQHRQAIDAWYLDGFAPSKNADMWSEELFRLIAALSKPGTTMSSFSAAGHVRRKLRAEGFLVHKQVGFAGKREMLLGTFEDPSPSPSPSPRYRRNRWFPAATWYSTPVNSAWETRETLRKKVAIIGAGLAGCTTAAALADRGIQSTIFESHHKLAGGASGNPGAALYSPLSQYSSPLADFSLQAYVYACHYYSIRLATEPCGLLQFIDDWDTAFKLANYIDDSSYLELLDSAACANRAGLDAGRAALYFPQGRAIHMAELCQLLIQREQISVKAGLKILDISGSGNALRLRTNHPEQHTEEYGAVVVCCGPHSRQFSQLSHLPSGVIRGQLTAMSPTKRSSGLRAVLCEDSYLTPAKDGKHWSGSSYVLDDWTTDLRNEEHRQNTAAAAVLVSDPSFAQQAASDGWVALRCTSPDYLPIVGPAPIESEFYSVFADLQHDKNKPLNTPAPYHQGLFVNTAYGSRGLCFAPLCAEQLASQINNEFSPLPSRLRHALSPARFIVRNITRGHFAAH